MFAKWSPLALLCLGGVVGGVVCYAVAMRAAHLEILSVTNARAPSTEAGVRSAILLLLLSPALGSGLVALVLAWRKRAPLISLIGSWILSLYLSLFILMSLLIVKAFLPVFRRGQATKIQTTIDSGTNS